MDNDELKNTAKKALLKKLLLSSSIGCSPLLLGIFVIFFVVLVVVLIFFGTDIEGGTSSAGGSGECGFTISRTSLSSEEFKSKLRDYANTYSGLKIFADNADGIYKYAKSKNVNPELVPIRAVLESASGVKVPQPYNYWGMGCANTGGAAVCFGYNSFEEGYSDYINNVSQYDSLKGMMSKYAYIGAYWYNPGGSGIGGCYYAEYIYGNNMPSRVKSACAPDAPICTGGGGSCTVTTAEDQDAYASWQVKKMAEVREAIFGLAQDAGPCNKNNNGQLPSTGKCGADWNNADAWITKNVYAQSSLYGQCTWFAWGRFYEMYGYSPGFTGNGADCAQQLVDTYPDKFVMSSTPKAGAVFSSPGPVTPYGHVGIVYKVDGDNITIQEGNLDGITNTWAAAQQDCQEVTYSKAVLEQIYPGIMYANPR